MKAPTLNPLLGVFESTILGRPAPAPEPVALLSSPPWSPVVAVGDRKHGIGSVRIAWRHDVVPFRLHGPFHARRGYCSTVRISLRK